jgi:hypothetical protein
MSRWIVAFPLLAVGVSISDGRAAMSDPVAKAVTGELTATQKRPAQAPATSPKSAPALHHKHHLARRPKPPAHDPLLAVLAKARPTVAPPVSRGEDEEISRPHSVNTIWVLAPVSAPPATSRAAASSDARWGRGQDEDYNPDDRVMLADKHDDPRISPIRLRAPASPAELTTTDLMALLGTCGAAAICIYGLVAFNSRQRRSHVGLLRSSRRSRARLPAPNSNHHSDRVTRQRVFPHQFGAAIQGR